MAHCKFCDADYEKAKKSSQHCGSEVCAEAFRAAARANYAASPKRREQLERARIKNRYGISLEERAEMLAKQGGACPICLLPPEPPHIDHDHKTGALRGVLCSACNRALGFLKDDPEAMRRAADYVEAKR